jgi:hypothetical protein
MCVQMYIHMCVYIHTCVHRKRRGEKEGQKKEKEAYDKNMGPFLFLFIF